MLTMHFVVLPVNSKH